MEPIKALLLLVFAALVSSGPVQWSSSECATSCRSDPRFVRFSAQKTFEYALKQKTIFNDQEVLVDAQLEISAHSPCDLSLQFTQTRVAGFGDEGSRELAALLEQQPIHFGYDDGTVTSICASPQDDPWAVNIKKAVISAFQMSATSLDQRSQVMESDIHGNCETTYQPIIRKYNQLVVKKSKSLNNCIGRQETQMAVYPGSFDSYLNNLPLMSSNYECQQTIDKDIVIGATCEESQQLRGLAASKVLSQMNIRFERTTSGVSSRRPVSFVRHSLQMSPRFDSEETQDLTQILRQICQTVDRHEKSVESFPQLIQSLRKTDSQEIKRISQNLQQICSENQLKDLFLDAAALSASEGGVQVLVQAYQSGQVSKERANYLFSLLSFTSSPTERAVEAVQQLLASKDTPKHVVLGISGLIHNLKALNQNESQSKRAISSLVQRLQSDNNPSSRIGTIKALENIGVENHSNARQVLIQLAQNQNEKSGVRSAAIKALTEGMTQRERQQLIELFAKESENNEIRLNAYKSAVMSGVSSQELNQIKQVVQKTNNRDVRQFVRSHQKNLRETSDPHKRYALPQNNPRFDEPQQQWFGVSNNFESSFMVDALSVGVAVEADVIHAKESQLPRSVTMNLTVPLFGRELNLIEVEFRQKGFESQIQQRMRQMKNSRKDSLVKEMLVQAFEIIGAHEFGNSGNQGDAQMQVYVKVDGKTILSVDSRDAQNGNNDWQQMYNKLRERLDQRLDIDRAFAVQPINTRVHLPTTNGMPIVVRVNATLIASLKASTKVSDFQRNSNSKIVDLNLQPQFAIQVEAGVQLMAKNQKKSISVVSRFSSAPVWDSKAEIRENRILNVKVNLPQERQTLIKAQTQVYSDGRQQQNSNSWYSNSNHKACTQSLKKPLGIQFCAQIQGMSYELSLEKSDRNMKSLDLQIESPQKGSQEQQNYRISFNTPSSEVDRELSAEVQIQNPRDGRKSAKIDIRSPWIRYSVEAGLRNEDKEQSIQLDVQQDGKKAFSLDLGLESQQRGQKREYRPRLRIQMSPQSEAIQMQGSVSVSKGRKNQLQIQLEGNQKQFLKGSFVREGERKSNDIRVSSDLSANFPGIEARVHGIAEKSSKHAETDLTVEYRLRGQRKESLKVSMKVQNLTQSQMTKASAFGELTSTQWPQANFHLAYNLLAKPEQQLENELTLAWTKALTSKVHVLHVTKVTQQSANQRKIENSLNLEITPLNVNYEIRANADVETNRDGAGPKYQAEIVGKDRTGRKENDMKASFQYKHLSRSPLHLTLDLNLKTNNKDIQYSDELKERSNGEYQGHTSFQWNKGKKAELEYNYKMQGQLHHEMDAQLKMNDHVIKHTGLLKMSPREFQLKSKILNNDKQLYSIDSLLSRDQSSNLEAQTLGYAVKAAVNPYVVPQVASWEVFTPNARINNIQHKTNIEYVPRTAFSLKSESKRNNRPVVGIEAHFSRSQPSRLIVNSEPIEGRLDCDLLSQRRTASLALKSQQNDWSHSSSWASDPEEYQLKVKTVSKGNPILNIDSNYNSRIGQNSYLNLEIPQQRSSLSINRLLNGRQKSGNLELLVKDLKHKTEYDFSPKTVKITSKTDQNRRQIHSLDYSQNNGIHSLDSELFQNYKLSANGQFRGEQPFLQLDGQHKSSQTQFNTKVSKQNNKIQIETKAKQRGESLAQLNAELSPSYYQESHASFQSPQMTVRVQSTPSQSGQFEWDSPLVNHVSQMQWKSNDYSLDSKSLLKRNNRFLNINAKHSLKMSRLLAKGNDLEAEIELDRNNKKTIKLGVDSRYPSYPYSHVSRVSIANPLTFESKTLSNSKNVFTVDGRIDSSAYSAQPSTVRMQIGQHLDTRARVQPFGQKKSFGFEAKNPRINHFSELDMDSSALTLKSRTDDSERQYNNKVDAFLTRDPQLRSHVSFVSKNANSNFEFEPKIGAKFELNAQPIRHKTQIQRHADGIRVTSQTTRGDNNLLDINSNIGNQWSQDSHLSVKCPQIESQLSGNPSQRSGKFIVKTKTYEHQSDAEFPEDNDWKLNSKTLQNNALLAKIAAKMNRQNNHQLEFESQWFNARSHLNLPQKSAEIEFRSRIPSGRHILGSINLQKGFHSDIAWDLNKDPNDRLILDINAERDPQQSSWSQKAYVYTLSANYAGNEAKVMSSMTTSHPIRGPHEVQFSYVPKYNPKRDSFEVDLKHEIKDNQMQCSLQYREAQKQKYSAKFDAKVENQGSEQSVQLNLETQAPHNPEMEVKVSLIERHTSLRQKNKEIFVELKALKTSLEKQYLVSFNAKQNGEEIKGNGRLETPETGPQDLEFVYQQNQLKMWSQNQSRKQLELNAQFREQNQRYVADFDFNSNVRDIPSVSANGVFKPYEEASLTVDVDQQRKVDFNLRKSGNSYGNGLEIDGRFDTSFSPKIETKNQLIFNSNEIKIQSTVKYNDKEISSVDVTAKKESGVWSGRGQVAANGAELAKASIESSFGTNTMQYILQAKSRQMSPIKVEFNTEKISSNERKVGVNVCTNNDECAQIKAQWKRSSRSQVIPEKAFLSVTKRDTNLEIKTSFMEDMETNGEMTSLLGVSRDNRVQKKTRNQIQVSINSHALGVDCISQTRSNGYDASVRVQFPNNRVLHVKTDSQQSSTDVIVKNQVIIDSEEPLFETLVKMQKTERRVAAELQVSSNRFKRSPKTVSFEIETQSEGKPFASKLNIDLNENPNKALIFESKLIQSSFNSWSKSAQNSTFQFNASTRDKRSLDFQLSSHLSDNSFGIHYKNLNKRGNQRIGSLLVKKLSENRFEANLKNENNEWEVQGSHAQNAVQFKVTNEKTGHSSDVRVALEDQCARFETKSQSGERKRFDLCAHLNNRNDKSLGLSLESDGKKSLELGVELDSRDQKSLKARAQWDPNYSFESMHGISFDGFQEIADEIQDKSRVLSQQFESLAAQPLADEFYGAFQEVSYHFRRVSSWFLDSVQQLADNVSQSASNYVNRAIRSARKQCKRSEMCFKAIYAFENYGLESVWEAVAETAVQALRQSHRLVMTTTGRLQQSLPDWVSTFAEYYQKAVSNAWYTIMNSNDDLRQLSQLVETIARELAQNWDQINWQEIRRAFTEIKEIAFSSQSSRVVVWDPKRGQASLEIRSPVIQSRRLRAVVQNVTDEIKKKDSIKSMFY